MEDQCHRNQCLEVALVGRRLPDNENLGLGYLQAALLQADIPSHRYVLNEWRQVEAIAADTCAGLLAWWGFPSRTGEARSYRWR